MTLHGSPCPNQISPPFPVEQEENPQETPSLIGCTKRHAGSRAMYVFSHSRWAPRLYIGQDPFLPKDLQMVFISGDIISVICFISKALSHNWNLHLHSSCCMAPRLLSSLRGWTLTQSEGCRRLRFIFMHLKCCRLFSLVHFPASGNTGRLSCTLLLHFDFCLLNFF